MRTRGGITAGIVKINRRADVVDLEAPVTGPQRSRNGLPEDGAYAYGAVTKRQAVYA